MSESRQGLVEANAPSMIVGIGASAGGLAALKAFFAASAPDPRVAYLVVTHLPTRSISHLQGDHSNVTAPARASEHPAGTVGG